MPDLICGPNESMITVSTNRGEKVYELLVNGQPWTLECALGLWDSIREQLLWQADKVIARLQDDPTEQESLLALSMMPVHWQESMANEINKMIPLEDFLESLDDEQGGGNGEV